MKQKNYFSIVRATLLVLLGMLLVPSSVRATIEYGITTNDFWIAAHFNNYSKDMGDDYPGISGAKFIRRLNYTDYTNKNSHPAISYIACIENQWNLARRTDDDNQNCGLKGSAGALLAITELRAGDIVNIEWVDIWNVNTSFLKYSQSVHAVCGNSGDIYNNNNYTIPSGQDITITSDGDLFVRAEEWNVCIRKITIKKPHAATYSITKSAQNHSTTFTFTGDGRLEENEFALPYMSVYFGNVNDFMLVNNTKSEMYDYNKSEDLKLDGSLLPSSGSTYKFMPTGKGNISVTGAVVHAHGATSGNAFVRIFKWKNDDPNKGWVWYNGQPYWQIVYGPNDNASFNFDVEPGYTYYICEDNRDGQTKGSFRLHSFTFRNDFYLDELAKIVDLENDVVNNSIQLTKITGASSVGNVMVKRCTGNISPSSVSATIDQYHYLHMSKPVFAEGTDEAGSVIFTINTDGGEATFVATFPYHADYNPSGYTDTKRTYGHTWNFLDPREADSNIGNSLTNDGWGAFTNGTTTGILSIGQYKEQNSQFRHEADKREWTYAQRITGMKGGFHDPMYKNVFDMEGDNADMIWETEGLWFDTDTNLSCLYNENDEDAAGDKDRYVGLLPSASKLSAFKIPGLKDGDRVHIRMKAGDATDRDVAFFNIEGARDAVGTQIDPNYEFGVGGTQWLHNRYEGDYHFIKDGDGDMKFYMIGGSMTKLLSIHIYKGERIKTNEVSRVNNSSLLFMNNEDDTEGAGGSYNLHYRGKGEQMVPQILVKSGNLSDDSFSSDKFYVSDSKKTVLTFKSTVGEFGTFRLRLKCMDFPHDADNNCSYGNGTQGSKYVTDFCDRNFTVGYRETYEYPYTWDLTDMMGYSSEDIAAENTLYPETTIPFEAKGWDISLWDNNGYMIIGNPNDENNHGDIFSQNKNGFGNQLYANDKMIPETRGLWFYMDDNQSKYNRCLQITDEGLCFINQNLSDDSHDPWWNYKVVVPSVPADGAVYLRMKRDSRVNDTDYKQGNNGNVLFLNTRFAWGTSSKTSLSEPNTPYSTQENGASYSFIQVDGTTDEYIVAVKNTTGNVNHLTFTLNGWILKKLAVSQDEKTITGPGFASESRNRAIDHSLTGYMVGKDIKAYVVTEASASTNSTDGSLTVQQVTGILPAGQGCFLVNNPSAEYDEDADNSVQILNDKTNLFVADMHDQENISTFTTNLMKAMVNGGTIAQESDGNINYVLASSHQSASNPNNVTQKDKVAFYRAAKNGGASVPANGAYLAVPKAVSNSVKAFYMIYDYPEEPLSEDYGDQDVTSISLQEAADVNAVWYNMNGQKLNGRPNASGIYVVNGKKIVIK